MAVAHLRTARDFDFAAGGSSRPSEAEDYDVSYLYRLEGETEPLHEGLISGPGWYTWPAAGSVPADELVLRTRCINSQRCFADAGRPDDTFTLVRNFGFYVEDVSQPTVGDLGGALMEGAAQRSTRSCPCRRRIKGAGSAG